MNCRIRRSLVLLLMLIGAFHVSCDSSNQGASDSEEVSIEPNQDTAESSHDRSDNTDSVVAYIKFSASSNPAQRSVVYFSMWESGLVVWHEDGDYFFASISDETKSSELARLREYSAPLTTGQAFAMPSSSSWEIGIRSSDGSMQEFIWDERTPGSSPPPKFQKAWQTTKSYMMKIDRPSGTQLSEDQAIVDQFSRDFPGYFMPKS